MSWLVARWWAWQCGALIQSVCLAAAILCVDLASRRRLWPQLRYALWLLVLVKLVVPPGLATPWNMQRLVAPTIARIATATRRRPPSSPVVALTPEAGAAFGSPPRNTFTGPAGAGGEAQPSFAAPEAEDLARGWRTLGFREMCLAVWLAVAVALACSYTCLRRRFAAALRDGCEEDVPSFLPPLLGRLAADLGLRRTPQLVVTDLVRYPAVFGIRNVRVLLPRRLLRGLTPEQGEHILLHELLHIKRRDHWALSAHLLLLLLHWPNPALWLLLRPLRDLRELGCDVAVAERLGSRTCEYRATLLAYARELLTIPQQSMAALGLLGVFGRSSALAARLHALDGVSWHHSRLRRTSIVLAATAVGCFVLPTAVSRARPERAPIGPASQILVQALFVELPAEGGTTEDAAPLGTLSIKLRPGTKGAAKMVSEEIFPDGREQGRGPDLGGLREEPGLTLEVEAIPVDAGIRLTGVLTREEIMARRDAGEASEGPATSYTLDATRTCFSVVMDPAAPYVALPAGTRGNHNVEARLSTSILASGTIDPGD